MRLIWQNNLTVWRSLADKPLGCGRPPTVDNGKVEKTMQESLSQFLCDYCAAFRAGNIDAVANYFEAPLVMVFADQHAVLDTQAKICDLLQSMMTTLLARGFARSEVDRVSGAWLSDKTALISAEFTRYKVDGTVLERLGATYTVIASGVEFKIVSVVAHSVDAVLSLPAN